MNNRGINVKNHRTYGKSHISLFVMSDPTQTGKTVKIPLWIRFPIVGVILMSIVGLFLLFGKITHLESVIAEQNLTIQTNKYSINERDEKIETLTSDNQKHYEELKELQTMTNKLLKEYNAIESYKEELDVKVNSTDKTTDTKPQGFNLQKEEHDNKVLTASAQYKELRVEMLGEEVEQGFDEEIEMLKKKINNSISSISTDQEKLVSLNEQLDEIMPYWDAYPSAMPVNNSYVRSAFGYRKDPITFRTDFHSGIDLAARYTSVYAAGAGKVISSKYERSYGYCIIIDHGYGLKTRYAHLSKLLVNEGEHVKRGDKIAISGNSGRSTGPHLHYEVIENGECQNPMDYIYKGE